MYLNLWRNTNHLLKLNGGEILFFFSRGFSALLIFYFILFGQQIKDIQQFSASFNLFAGVYD